MSTLIAVIGKDLRLLWRDKAGLIVFGRRPRLELPPSDAPQFNFQELAGTIDGNYTDIAAALKLALASFPEGTGKRIVLLSDGNQNRGDADVWFQNLGDVERKAPCG